MDHNRPKHVVIVGGGFAGVGCARKLASQKEVRVTRIDKNNTISSNRCYTSRAALPSAVPSGFDRLGKA